MTGEDSRDRDRRLAVLAFHKIGEPPRPAPTTWFYISVEAFKRYLKWLQESHWRILDAQTFLAGIASPATLPSRCVLLTFDDGYRSMRDTVLPVLRSLGFPAVLFVPTDFIGSSNRFDAGVEPEEPICDWDNLRDLQANGISIQSHGVSHRRFSALTAAERAGELRDSKALLEMGLRTDVKMFSFPYGDVGRDRLTTAAELRDAGYSVAFLYGGVLNPVPLSDVYQVERVPMGPGTDLAGVLEGARTHSP